MDRLDLGITALMATAHRYAVAAFVIAVLITALHAAPAVLRECTAWYREKRRWDLIDQVMRAEPADRVRLLGEVQPVVAAAAETGAPRAHSPQATSQSSAVRTCAGYRRG